MNRNRKENYILILCIFLFLIFSGLSIYSAKYVQDNLSAVSARYKTAVVSTKAVSEVLENLQKDSTAEVPEITLWNRLEKEAVINVFTGRSVTTNVIETYGDMSQVIPMVFTSGNYVYRNDQKGCVLDTKTAYDLFGTIKAVNNMVMWKEKEYVVRGVSRAKDRMMLIQISEENHIYSNIEGFYKKKENQGKIDNQAHLLEDLLVQNGIPEPDAIIDGDFISGLLKFTYRVPLWIITLEMLVRLIKRVYRFRGSIFLCTLSLVAVLAFIILLLNLSVLQIHIPNQFVPTKWSDFDFYVNKYNEVQKELLHIKNSTHMPKDILLTSYQWGCMVSTLFAVFILIFVRLHRWKHY